MSGLLLAVESGGDQVSAALFAWPAVDAAPPLSERSAPAGRDHGRQLVPLIDRLCRDAGAAAGDLVAVAVARGPGSYTGLRVGIATALGVAAAGGIPVYGAESLRAAALAHAARAGVPVVALLPAGRGGLYAQAFAWPDGAVVPRAQGDALRIDAGGAEDVVAAAGPGTLAVAVGGEAAAALGSLPPGRVHAVASLSAVAVGRLVIALVREGVRRHGEALAVAPIYLRPAATATGA